MTSELWDRIHELVRRDRDIEHDASLADTVARVIAERDALRARAERAESERDEARKQRDDACLSIAEGLVVASMRDELTRLRAQLAIVEEQEKHWRERAERAESERS